MRRGKLVGVFTDGDFRRRMSTDEIAFAPLKSRYDEKSDRHSRQRARGRGVEIFNDPHPMILIV